MSDSTPRYVPASAESIDTLITQIGQDVDNKVWERLDRQQTLNGLRELLTIANHILAHHKNGKEVNGG